jgi:hypothetical protein
MDEKERKRLITKYQLPPNAGWEEIIAAKSLDTSNRGEYKSVYSSARPTKKPKTKITVHKTPE